jgi:dephospho-CoA kinase
MKRVLLTGMSGTGKSSVVQELLALGYKAVVTDYGISKSADDGEWAFGKDSQELARVRDELDAIEPLNRRGGGVHLENRVGSASERGN